MPCVQPCGQPSVPIYPREAMITRYENPSAWARYCSAGRLFVDYTLLLAHYIHDAPAVGARECARVLLLALWMGGETGTRTGPSTPTSRPMWRQFELERPRDTSHSQKKVVFNGQDIVVALAPAGAAPHPIFRKITICGRVCSGVVSDIIGYNPAPVPGPVVSRTGDLEALSSSRVDLDAVDAVLTISSVSSR